MKSSSLMNRLFTLFALVFTGFAMSASAQNHLVISQIYGGGGNSGSPSYTYDFIELYNPTNAAIDVSGYSVQYASSGGTGWQVGSLSSGGSIQPGKYFLIKAASQGTSTTQDFTADATITINIATASGKLALVSNQTALAGTASTPAAPLAGTSCPTTNAANIVDFFGYGTSATCTEGAGTTSNATITSSLIRNASNADTDVNSSDFTTLSPPNPRNSSYSSTPVTTLRIANTSAATVTAGTTSAMSVTVSPGAMSTGITVTADLTQIGGSATTSFTLSSTANTYTYTAPVPANTAANTYQLPVTVKDLQGATATGSISLTVQAPAAPPTPIATIQGNRSTYVGTKITTTGVITLVTNAGFFMQTPSTTPGSTGVAEGIYIYNGTGKNPATVLVGNDVTVTGNLTLFPAATASHTPSLEIASSALTVNSTNQPLPTPISLTAINPTGGIYQLTKYEGMLAKAASLTAITGTDGFLTENTETITSSGQFFTVFTGTARPFREPGIDFRDFPTSTCPSVTNCTATATAAGVARPTNLTLFDDNPERLIVESSLGGGNALDLSAGAVITNAVGVVDFSYSNDVPYGDPARLILQPGSVTTFTPGIAVAPLAVPSASQFTVAAFNIERFFNTNSADDLYYDPVANTTKKSLAVDVTADAYARRLKKVSLAIRTVLNSPDVISVEEVENVSVLQDIAKQIDTDAFAAGGTAPGYVAYGTDSINTFTDDIGGISIGFLVKPATVNVTAFEQVGGKSTFTASTGTQTLNDRPSDVLHAGIKRANGAKDYPITVISNHLRSLSGINTSADTRLKKELQAEMLATLIQNYQANGEHVIAVGDLNAFQFSDGYTDTLGTITGNVGNNVAAQQGKAIVSPAAVDLVTTLPAAQQQSYTEFGNAQVLDHVVVTADIAGTTQLAFAHINADFPETAYNDATTPARESDHDPALAYLAIPAPTVTGTVTGTAAFGNQAVSSTSTGKVIVITNTGESPITFTSIATTGDFAQTNNCGTSLAVNSNCSVNVVFKPTVAGSRAGTLTITSNATGITSIALTGTGVVPDFSLAPAANATVTVAAGASASLTLNIAPTNGFAGTVTFACASTGTAPSGVVCAVTPSVAIAAGGTGAATVLFATTPRSTSAGVSSLPGSTSGRLGGLLALLMTGAAFATLKRNRRVWGVLCFVLLLSAAALGMTGCGSSSHTATGTQAGTYNYTVTATSGTITHTQNVTLIVQ